MRHVTLPAILCCCLPAFAQPPVGFDESANDRLRVFTDTYELALSKSNGAILALTDKTAKIDLNLSSRNGCLWGSGYQGAPPPYRGGCSFSAAHPDSFSYSWNAGAGALSFVYQSAADSMQRVEAAVTLSFQPSSFDMQLHLVNHMGSTMQTMLFPSDLLLQDSSIQAAYLPYYLPGVRLKPDFFKANRSISAVYPSARAFADYVALDINGGRVSWSAVNPDGAMAPVTLGFQDDDKTKAGTFYAFHTFQTWVPDGGKYATPVIRVRIGQGPDETIAAYRNENGIADYPSLGDKLGDQTDTVAHAPLVKMDLRSIGRTFAELSTRLAVVRTPAILHPVSYWPPAFDRNYPDFLPPHPRFGTIADFSAFTDAAHARGLLVMPYTNPTWWDDQSPTARAASSVASLAAEGLNGKPVYESYGVNRGFVASPYVAAVTDRIASLMAQWRDQVPVDFVLQDQIGSRSWLRDFNPAAPDPQSYSAKWLEITQTYSGQNLMTEDGWDRLASTETGFTGSLLTGATNWTPATVRWGPGSRGNTAFGEGNWEPYPLGVWLFHDKVLLYHHDLDNQPMNAGIEVLTWNAAFGVMAGYYWPESPSVRPDWAPIAMAFQPAILSRTAGRALTSYLTLAPDVTESRFDSLAVVANWNPGSSYAMDGYMIAPSGCLARTDDGSVVGGAFVERFNGSPLSAGVHFLVIEQADTVVTVRQPSGADTSLTVTLPADWDAGAGIQVRAVGRDNQMIGNVPFTLDGRRSTFFYVKVMNDALVDHYEIGSL